MMVKRFSYMLVVAMLFTAALPVHAAKNAKTVTRSWLETGSGPISTVLVVVVPVLGSDDQGNPTGGFETRFINVAITLQTPAPLFKGEIESFELVGAATGNPQQPDVVVAIKAKHAYHCYGQAVDTVPASGNSASLTLTHTGRVPNTPPASFRNVSVEFTAPAEPFTFQFFDFAMVDLPEAKTSYEFVIKRSRWFGADKLVARGVVAGPEHGGLTTLTITDGCPFTEGADEYFSAGRSYYIDLRLKREATPLYTDDWSPADRFRFVWKEGHGGQLEPDLASTPTGEAQQQSFDELHHD